ncbi:uncharacterized protein [Typha angustifolia]|uniref:uncharacterized protein isoform X2 n=1 Tax=Typha angustifolia TaxID=59011 RepID=UPI003C2DFCD3
MLRVSEDGSRRREEHVASYRQLGRSLLDLQRAADRVFAAISRRTAEERDKLSEISQRIQLAKAKIDTISRSEQALTIISPARHPSICSTNEAFQPLFRYNHEENDAGFPVAKLLVNGGLNREFGIDGTLELFQFFSEENIEYPLKDDFKARVKLGQTKDDIPLENFFETASFLTVSTSESRTNTKREELPPPPPSLLVQNFSLTSKSEDFKFMSADMPSCSEKHPDEDDAPSVVSD